MEKIQPYGAFHILYFLVGIAICILVSYKLRNINEKQNKILLYSLGGILLVTEIYKQFFYYYVLGHGSYQWWIFPFQLCSIPMYLCFIAPNVKNIKVQKAIYNFMLAFNLMGGFISFFEPSGLIHEYVTLTAHAFLWHMLLVFIGIYLGMSKRAGTVLKEYKGAIITYVNVCVIAFIINILLHNMGDINMFYVGPYLNSPIIVFKNISQKYGWYVNTPIYMACNIFASYIFYYVFIKINSKRDKRVINTDNKNNKKVA